MADKGLHSDKRVENFVLTKKQSYSEKSKKHSIGIVLNHNIKKKKGKAVYSVMNTPYKDK